MAYKTNARYLLALHSSTNKFAIALLDLTDEKKRIKSSVFHSNQQLSNNLFKYVETLLPMQDWLKIARLAVAIGPGSFTGTRLSIVMARTLAQQINCELDGISSFALMAPRLSRSLNSFEIKKPFWIVKQLKRRGIIAGKYKILQKGNIKAIEIRKPYLLEEGKEVNPALEVEDDVSNDIEELINNCLHFYKENKKSDWEKVRPIYPTSPVNKIY